MRILHVLSQRPSLTGSGITLDAVVRHAAPAGWEQRVVVGASFEDPAPSVGGLPSNHIHPLVFGAGRLNFPVPGMSDVMPYPSTRFSELDEDRATTYRQAWAEHLRSILRASQPQLIHSHHLWLLSAMLKDLAPGIPVVTQCHATGFRQMELCPHLAQEVRTGCARNDSFLVLHEVDGQRLQGCLGVSPKKVHVVGAGYRDELFHARGRDSAAARSLLYIGKYSAAKGLPWLLDAFEILAAARPGLRLHVAGSGAGAEAEALRARMVAMAPGVVLHGQLAQPALADLMRRAGVCVLPSFYEGLPLVLVEALACGCRLVATALPGIDRELAPRLGDGLEIVALPRLVSVDQPHPGDLPAFVDRLTAAIGSSLDAPALDDPATTMPEALEPFTWRAVFAQVEEVWRSLT